MKRRKIILLSKVASLAGVSKSYLQYYIALGLLSGQRMSDGRIFWYEDEIPDLIKRLCSKAFEKAKARAMAASLQRTLKKYKIKPDICDD